MPLDAQPFTSDTLIRDGEVYRWDFDGLPRYYFVRIYPSDRNRVKVCVELEGDPTAWSDGYCDDDAEDINLATSKCIGDIEQMCANDWDREAVEELNDMRRSEARFYYR